MAAGPLVRLVQASAMVLRFRTGSGIDDGNWGRWEESIVGLRSSVLASFQWGG